MRRKRGQISRILPQVWERERPTSEEKWGEQEASVSKEHTHTHTWTSYSQESSTFYYRNDLSVFYDYIVCQAFIFLIYVIWTRTLESDVD